MELSTKCFWPDWDRIVDIAIYKGNGVPEEINDDSTYKILFLEKGELTLKTGGKEYDIKAPSFIILSNHDRMTSAHRKPVGISCVFFNPTAIRDEFRVERIDSGEFDGALGQVIYQDYVLIAPFSGRKDLSSRIFSLPVSGVGRISALINGMDNELKSQRDGFWPCRSRSYLFELLYYINYSYIYIDQTDASLVSERDYFSEAVEYLNEHMRDHMTLEKITKELSINRNRLNEIFVEKTSSTCMNYFMQMRIELAKLMLKGTELMINEIGDRVGYPDANYFTKVFRQNTGMTPTEYRKKTT